MEENILKLYEKYKSERKVAKELGITRYQVSKVLGKVPKQKKIIKNCIICGKSYETSYSKKTTCSKLCRSEFKKRYFKDRKYNYDSLVDWRIKNKKKSVEYKGGKCIVCGYNKCLSALEFHHVNPKEKDFSISTYKNKKFEDLKKELDKCVLVCSNCHKEIHESIIVI